MSVCVNDTDGDGNCAACARNPDAPCRKSAGDALKIALLEIRAPAKARGMVDAYAHELAEKIRAEVRQFKADEILEPDKDWTAAGAADLIDPEKES